MAHRKTQEKAQEVKVGFETNHPSATIVIKSHPRGGYLIVESRECEECGDSFTTAAIGELDMSGDYCRNCKSMVYERERKLRKAEAGIRNAEIKVRHDAEAWYNAEEGTGRNF